MAGDTAWSITRRTFAYTNHTLLPEALERWPLALFRRILPRHMEIVFEINARFLDEVRIRFFGDEHRVTSMSLIDENGERFVRMAHLACVGSHAINGVAALHSELLKTDVLRDFYAMWPEKFSNKTNGVTPRRWIALSNPGLTQLVSEVIGDDWVRDLSILRQLEPFAKDAAFLERWQKIKHANKATLAKAIRSRTGVSVDPNSLFDVQVKRIHEYKRQHLNILHVIALYHRLRSDSQYDMQPRTFIFGGKAAPGYYIAKLIIKLITSVGDIINKDPAVKGRIKVVYWPNFNVKTGQYIYPAADLSEQISTAGKEASGTGNMKFCMNGALTIGTQDGANIEIRNEVGAENFFSFGLSAQEVYELKAQGYHPGHYYDSNAELHQVLDLIKDGFFSRGDTQIFKPLIDGLLGWDPYLVLADFQSYADCQRAVSQAYSNGSHWSEMSVLNVARSDGFSSDRTIREYADETWKVPRVPIRLLSEKDLSFNLQMPLG